MDGVELSALKLCFWTVCPFYLRTVCPVVVAEVASGSSKFKTYHFTISDEEGFFFVVVVFSVYQNKTWT